LTIKDSIKVEWKQYATSKVESVGTSRLSKMASLIPSAPTISGADGSLTVNPVLVNPILEKVRKTTFYYCQKSSEMHQAWVSRHFNKGSIFRRRCQQNSGMLVAEDLRHFINVWSKTRHRLHFDIAIGTLERKLLLKSRIQTRRGILFKSPQLVIFKETCRKCSLFAYIGSYTKVSEFQTAFGDGAHCFHK